MSICCSNCFKDKFLEKQIVKFSDKIGTCDYCESTNVAIINAIQLQDFFEEIIDIYEINDTGMMLSEILELDWKMFNINRHIANSLIAEILNNQEILTQKYINTLEKTSSDVWENFKQELKHNNRYFPNDREFNKDSLKETIEYFESFDYTKEVFRGRINNTNEIIPQEEMGKPPCEIASQGRANPVGISYLYVASDEETAISEIRPDKGDIVTMAKIILPENLRFLDIRSPKNTISPFDFSDNVLEALYRDIDLLERFGEELSKPVLPRKAHLEYLASQYLTELVKHYGFDGLLYKSSVGSGYNIVIFNDIDIEFIELKRYNINNTSIDFEVF